LDLESKQEVPNQTFQTLLLNQILTPHTFQIDSKEPLVTPS
jgi:ABC-type enterochelin transport system permease subunit